MNDAFRAALRAHIQQTSLYEPRERLSLVDVLITMLCMLVVGALMVLVGMS